MTSLALDAPQGVQGSQQPSSFWFPHTPEPIARFDENGRLHIAAGTTGADAIELAELAGLHLDPWQQFVLANSLTEHPAGSWAALRVVLILSRQNGKDAVLEARELAGLFLLGERLITHSAHRWDTSLEHLNRLVERLESTPELDAKVAKINRAHGEEGITLRNGARMHFRTRTKIGGVGFSADLLVFNEAMDIPEAAHGSLLPTLSARPHMQVWYTGSAVDQDVMENGLVFSRVRDQARQAIADPHGPAAERARRLMYCEWGVDEDAYQADPSIADDPEQWAIANPGLGIRITADWIETVERAGGLDEKRFLAQRLGIGDWPDPTGVERVISAEKWAACRDPASKMRDPVCLAFDVSPDRSRSAAAAAGYDQDGNVKCEIIRQGEGTAWIGAALAQLRKRSRPLAIVCDGRASGALLPTLQQDHGLRTHSGKGLPHGSIVAVTASHHAKACGFFYDLAEQNTLRHHGDRGLDQAVAGAIKRELSDAWAWDKRNSTIDITPLVAATLAAWGLREYRGRGAQVHAFSEEELRETEKLPSDKPPPGLPPLDPEDLDG